MTQQINRTAAMLLLISLGFFGVHSFYLGKKTQGILYILAFTIGWFLFFPPIIAFIFLVVEFYKLLTQTDEEFAAKKDLKYIPEKKNGLAAGAIALLGGIFGAHFSYLNDTKAAGRRFRALLIPLSFLLTIATIMTFLGWMLSGRVDFSEPQDAFSVLNKISTDFENGVNTGYLAIAIPFYLILFVLVLKSFKEAYLYFKYGIKDKTNRV